MRPIEDETDDRIPLTTAKKPPAVLMQETLQQMTAEVAKLQARVEDYRDTLLGSIQALDSTNRELVAQLDRMNQHQTAQRPPPAWSLPTLWHGGIAVVVLGLGLGVGWGLWAQEARYGRFALALHQGLTQAWATVPKPTQESLGTIYTQHGIQKPGEKK